jgi:hypothetical protein
MTPDPPPGGDFLNISRLWVVYFGQGRTVVNDLIFTITLTREI